MEKKMEIDKSQIIDLLKSRGEQDKASQAESELPEKVDTERTPGCSASSASTHRISSATCQAAWVGSAAERHRTH